MKENPKKEFTSFNLPKELVDDLKTWKSAFELNYMTNVSYEEMIKKMLDAISLLEPKIAEDHENLINPEDEDNTIDEEFDDRTGYKYSDSRYYDDFRRGEYITLTRKDGLLPSSKPWIIGIVAQDWNPGNDREVYLIADYTLRKGSEYSDGVEIYEKPEMVIPYYQGWRPSTPDEIKILDDALAHTGHKFNKRTGEIEEITPKRRVSMNYNLTYTGVFSRVETKDDFEPLYSEDEL